MTSPTVLLCIIMLETIQGRLCPDPICPPDDGTNRTILLPHANCRYFYSCTMSFPTMLACPPGLRFNETIPGCVPKNQADCSECQDPDPTKEPKPAPEQFINYFPFLH